MQRYSPDGFIEFVRDFTFGNGTCSESIDPAGKATRLERIRADGQGEFSAYINEFWTARQRQASSIHEVSYRGCYKPQLPEFFISRLTREGDTVYDPFSGRGTTVVEAGLLGRRVVSNDVNPLSRILTCPRFFPPDLADLKTRLAAIPMNPTASSDIDLSMFYHPGTLAEIASIRDYLAQREASGESDQLDDWIRMAATNRLTGHSRGFFSVYSLPPNQAVSAERQIKINQKLNQIPEYRDTRKLILKKTKSLLKDLGPGEIDQLRRAGETALFLTQDARQTGDIPAESVHLVVTSPPFLNVVQYSQDNWLRCWFNDIDAKAVADRITMAASLDAWSAVMGSVFDEFYRIVRPGGWICFEVGEVRNGNVKLEEAVIPLGLASGFECLGVLINEQVFTKTSNIWGVNNNHRGTNTNRVVMFRKGNRT